jgi:broad specificity phosphatase PhoE
MRRLLLVRHAPTDATRQSAFPRDEPLDERARRQAARLAGRLPQSCEAVSSPALRCRETALAAGLDPTPDPALAECDFGTWAGRSLADIDAADPAAARAWIADPDCAPHGGESLTDFARRVGRWLDGQARRSGNAVAVTHAGVVKGALVHALGAPIESFWRIDVAPLAITELHGHDGRWTISRVNHLPDADTEA